MSWRALFRRGHELDGVAERLIEMLEVGRKSLELAHQALFEGGDVESLRREISDIDHELNLLVQEVRGRLLAMGPGRAPWQTSRRC